LALLSFKTDFSIHLPTLDIVLSTPLPFFFERIESFS
jgi:hypothetical protein